MVVLVSGGTGLIGSELCDILKERGHEVRILSRRAGSGRYRWDVAKGEMDAAAMEGVEAIVHLAGATVAQRWTAKARKEILNSRVDSAALLLHYAKKYAKDLKVLVSASGVNYYGTQTTGREHKVGDPPANGDDFLSNVCIAWEAAADEFSSLCRVVKLRTGVVLTPKGGAYQKMAAPIKLGLGAPLGSGKQIVPWIGLQDLVKNFYVPAIEDNEWQGAFNAVDAQPMTNTELTKRIAKDLGKPLFLPNVPGFVLRTIYGEMASMLLEGDVVKRA